MTRKISRAENWELAYSAFKQVNLTAFDYDTIKRSLISYVKLYFPEDFNDFIESSEFIAILELFAYVGEIISYRLDLNAHENIITQAQRKESILRLVKLISYSTSRNIPARGLVKITSIQTSEPVFDAKGKNLSGIPIRWDDPNNVDWKSQFLTVMNNVLEQDFGTVNPSERKQVGDILFELYSWINNPISDAGSTVFPYSVDLAGKQYPMELVPVELTDDGPIERRPEYDAKFTLLYGADGLGDGSDLTGFFIYTKQGKLQRFTETFDGVTPNQTLDILIDNINETDVWVNNVDPSTHQILDYDSTLSTIPHLSDVNERYGEWFEVDTTSGTNIAYNYLSNRHKYEVETLSDDNVRLIFGDGELSDIPSGTFDIWYRVSANEDAYIPRTSVVDKIASFTYQDITGNLQTFTFTFKLINSLQNASKSEDIEHIRRVAPRVFETQDRMVSGKDYNNYMLQDPTILKLRVVNRTFAGDSKYMYWHDPSENYENVKIFGDDLAYFWKTQPNPYLGEILDISTPVEVEELINNYLEPIICNTDLYAQLSEELRTLGRNPNSLRCKFKNTPYSFDAELTERQAIENALLTSLTGTSVVELYYSVMLDEWTVGPHPCDTSTPPALCNPDFPANSKMYIMIEAQFDNAPNLAGWKIGWSTQRLIAQSNSTKFWNINGNTVVDYDTLNSVTDKLVVLSANINGNGDELLGHNVDHVIISQELVEQQLPDAGLPDINRVNILPADLNGDGIPDNMMLYPILNYDIIQQYQDYNLDNTSTIITLPSHVYYITDNIQNDVRAFVDGKEVTVIAPADEPPIGNRIILDENIQPTDLVRVVVKNYVYMRRTTPTDKWYPVETTTSTIEEYMLNRQVLDTEKTIIRYNGRYPLNFAWLHFTPRYHLVDPAASNIHDAFIITKGYYFNFRNWLTGKEPVKPTAPLPIELRTSYRELLQNAMISDSVVLHSGKFKLLFGSKAEAQVQATFKIIRPSESNTTLTDNEVKVRVVNAIREFFDIQYWEFGETFYFSELASYIHRQLGSEINSVVMVPNLSSNTFGDLFQVQAREDELFMPDISTANIEIVDSYTPYNIKQCNSQL